MLYYRILIGLFTLSVFTYLYIHKLNDVMELRLQIPPIAQELTAIEEENKRLQYTIDQFESPLNLLELSKKPEFAHLKYPYTKDVIVLSEKGEG